MENDGTIDQTREDKILTALADSHDEYDRRLTAMSKRIERLEGKRKDFDDDDPMRGLISMMIWIGVGRILFEVALEAIARMRSQQKTPPTIEGRIA